MASIIDRGDGRRAIQFENQRGERKTIGLGKRPKRDAESIRTKIEALIASNISGQPLTPEVAEWVAKLPAKLADKLAEFALIQAPGKADDAATLTLGRFWRITSQVVPM